jgi:hypothetical protein
MHRQFLSAIPAAHARAPPLARPPALPACLPDCRRLPPPRPRVFRVPLTLVSRAPPLSAPGPCRPPPCPTPSPLTHTPQSAALGLAIAGALGLGYANIFVTAPSPENLRTLFEFVFKGLDALGYQVGAFAGASGWRRFWAFERLRRAGQAAGPLSCVATCLQPCFASCRPHSPSKPPPPPPPPPPNPRSTSTMTS